MTKGNLLTDRKTLGDNDLRFSEPSRGGGCLIGMGDALEKCIQGRNGIREPQTLAERVA